MTPDRRELGAVLVGTVVTVAMVGWPVGALAGADVQRGIPSAGIDLDADETLMGVDVRPDGTATVRLEFRYRLDDQETEESFAAVRRDVEENPLNHSGPFAADMERAAAAAEDATGREMAVHNVTVNATSRRLPEPHGVLVFTFEWEGFAAVADGGRLRIGGTLAWMTLERHQTLLLSWPDEYDLVEATPTPTDEREGEVVWRGPEVFGGSGPTVVVESTGGHPGHGVPVVPVAAVVGALALALAGVVLRRRRRGAVPAEDVAEPTPDEDLLSDEERVLRLLEDQDGRMKQQDLVAAVDWSETKTSDVVQSLREEDRIEVYRIGRENVLALPGEMDV